MSKKKKNKKNKKSRPEIGLLIQDSDGVVRRGPGIIDGSLTVSELVNAAFESDYAVHFRLIRKDTGETFASYPLNDRAREGTP